MYQTKEQIEWARNIGLERCTSQRKRGSKNNFDLPYGADKNSTDIHYKTHANSAVAENELAVYLGLKWLSTGDKADKPEDGDIEGGIQVRWTPNINYSLIVREPDLDWQIYVLVVGEIPDMVIVGWFYGHEAKEKDKNGKYLYWRDNVPDPAWFVPQRALHSKESLKELVCDVHISPQTPHKTTNVQYRCSGAPEDGQGNLF